MESINILLIEDNPGDIELTRESLSRGKLKNNLIVVENGEDALNFLFQREQYVDALRPDIILLDLNLPKVSGRGVLQALKQDKKTQDIPVIILSSSQDASDIRESYQLHANCFVTKPVSLESFINVVQSIESFWIDIVKLPTAK
ncbi:MAG: response regulator [Oceanospirillaceae bacterium]